VGSTDAQAAAVQLGSVIFSAYQSPHFGNTRQMRGVERTDCAATDDANFQQTPTPGSELQK